MLRAMQAQDRDLVRLEPRDREVVSLLRSAQALIVAALREEIPRETVRADDERFHGYLRFLLAGQRVETLHATFLGPAGRYLHDEIVERGTTVGVELGVRDLVRKALELDAWGIILAHNHPSGSCEPSADDIVATRRIAAMLAPLDLELVDHLVIGADAITSMKIGGYLHE